MSLDCLLFSWSLEFLGSLSLCRSFFIFSLSFVFIPIFLCLQCSLTVYCFLASTLVFLYCPCVLFCGVLKLSVFSLSLSSVSYFIPFFVRRVSVDCLLFSGLVLGVLVLSFTRPLPFTFPARSSPTPSPAHTRCPYPPLSSLTLKHTLQEFCPFLCITLPLPPSPTLGALPFPP